MVKKELRWIRPMTTDISAYKNLSKPVERAIRHASKTSGVNFDYLMRTAARESAFNPKAKAATSSATGLYQFIDQTWLQIVKEAGPDHGLKRYAKAIDKSADGSYSVDSASTKRRILDLRKDPKIAAQMAAEFTDRNAADLKQVLKRAPTDGELYIAHFMGAGGASRFLSAVERSPDSVAAKLFPRQAAANKPIFYTSSGKARSLEQVYVRLAQFHDGARTGDVLTAGPVPPVPDPRPTLPASNLTPAQAIELASAALGQTWPSSDVATTPQPASPLSPEPPARPSRFAGWVAKSSHAFDSRFQRTGTAAGGGQDITTSTIPSRFAPAALDGQSLRAEIGRAESADDLRRAMNGPVDRQNVSRFASYSAKRDVTDPI
jgi:hypothetical protein